MKAVAVRTYALREMMRLLRRHPGRFVLAVLLTAAALVLPLTGASVAFALAPLADPLLLAPEVNLFLAAGTPATDIRQLQTTLAARPEVSRVEWITRDAAYKSLLQRTGGTLGEQKSNPLPDVLVVTLAPASPPAAVDAAVKDLRSLPKVDAVGADTGWQRKLDALLRVGTAVGLAVTALAVLLLLLLVLGAVQLQLATSRDEVGVLRMVGARTRFIVRPFAYAGALTLACGAALAAAVSVGAVALLGPPLSELASLYDLSMSVEPLPAQWLAAAIVGSAVVGGVTAALGARGALRALP
jgi:cell division transport system permease protein